MHVLLATLTWFAAAPAAAPACDATAMRTARGEFQRLYKAKRFKPALELLEPAFAPCEAGLAADQRARILSDLAIAAYRSGNRKLCLQFLDRVPGDASVNSTVASAIAHNRRLCRGEESGVDGIDCRNTVSSDDETLCSAEIWESAKKQLKAVVRAAEAGLRSRAKGKTGAWLKEFQRANRTWQEMVDVECGPVFTQEFGEWGTGFNSEQTFCEIELYRFWIQELQNHFALPGQVAAKEVTKPVIPAPCSLSDPHQCTEVVVAQKRLKTALKDNLAIPPGAISSFPDSPAKQIADWRKSTRLSQKLWLAWLDTWCVSALAAESAALAGTKTEPRPVQAMATCLARIMNQRLDKEEKQDQPAQ